MVRVNSRIIKGYKFRIFPSEEQKIFFEKTFGGCRFVWNYILEVKKEAFQYAGIETNFSDTSKGLTEIKKNKDLAWLNELSAQTLQQELRKLDTAYSRFFRKISNFPVFKAKYHKQSFLVPQHFCFENELLYIPKVKTPIHVRQHREFGSNYLIKCLSISKDKAGRYFVSFQVEEDKQIKKHKSNNTIGIDLGLATLITCSNGAKIPNPRVASKKRKKLAFQHRQLSKKEKGSKSREKTRLELAKTHNKISRTNLDYVHKITSKIIDENQIIIMEDLNVLEMKKDRKLAKLIQEVSWGEIVRQLKYKAEWNDRQFIQIDRFFPSSKTCSNDGFINQGLNLSQRTWICPKCQTNHDRDVNAAKNILAQGLNIIKQLKTSGSGIDSESKQKRRESLGKILGNAKKNTKAMKSEIRAFAMDNPRVGNL